MSVKNRKRLLMGLLAALGGALAFFVTRRVLNQRQLMGEESPRRVRERLHSGQGELAEMQTGTRYQPQDQPDRQPDFGQVPATGVSGVRDMVSGQQTGLSLDEQVAPLVQYLRTFQELIQVLRERRRTGEIIPGARSLTPQDRSYFDDALERLAPGLEGYGSGNLENALHERSLQERINRPTLKAARRAGEPALQRRRPVPHQR
jgi:hypothetical protein